MEGEECHSPLPSLYFLGQKSEVLRSPGPSPSLNLLPLSSCSSHMADEAFAQHSQPGLTSIPFDTHAPLDLSCRRHQISFAFTAMTSSDRLVKPHLSLPPCLQSSKLSRNLPVPSPTSLPVRTPPFLILQPTQVPTTSRYTLTFSSMLVALPVLGCCAHVINNSGFLSHL